MYDNALLIQFLNNLTHLENNCCILVIGPGDDTYEIIQEGIVSDKNDEINIQHIGESSLNCNQCPFIIKCQKRIAGNHLEYQACQFDKIILHAQTKLPKEDLFTETKRLLRANGQIITFMDHEKEGSDNVLNDLCFHSDWIIGQLGSHGFAIQSATSFRYLSSAAICLTASTSSFF